MADKVSIATASDKAIARLVAATNAISVALVVDPFVMPEKNRDHDYQNMAQLMALATWAEALAGTIEPIKNERSSDDQHLETQLPEPKRKR